MTNEDAAAIAALNQTVRQLVEELKQLNFLLDKYGFPRVEGGSSGRENTGR